MTYQVEKLDIESTRHNLRVIVVKDVANFWIILCGHRLAQRFEETRNANWENWYPWPPGSEHGVIKLARIDFTPGYTYPRDKEELFELANLHAEAFRHSLGLPKDESFKGEGI